ncbi:hypothetical protein [Mycobacterium tuberculosis]|uniref:hypothetical protein n=1 Tax=Mycobacterium tuberculosis TaxID=1773 RepID=UPI00272A977A|nr:hypothetical protein [Mycobacterium tuberculosis]
MKESNTNDYPKLRFETLSQRVPVSQLLNDFYLVDAMAKASSGRKLGHEAAQLKADVHKDVADRLAMYLVAAVITEAGYCFSDRNLTKLRPDR